MGCGEMRIEGKGREESYSFLFFHEVTKLFFKKEKFHHKK
jgi:hypothetical protein